tara:strand:+ start:843 stop:1025 length:183 start_codon:yes stop_codon:yes gene_type:complete
MTNNTVQYLQTTRQQALRAAAERKYAQSRTITYRGVAYDPTQTVGETHGTFTYRGRTYTK